MKLAVSTQNWDYRSEVRVTTLVDCCEVRIASCQACQGMSPGGVSRLADESTRLNRGKLGLELA